jgi:Protein of unknown function (DUF3300)
MDAVQRMRREARNYGYLVPNGYVNVVETGGYIEILPLNPAVFYVPYYDPLVVFARPRPGFVVWHCHPVWTGGYHLRHFREMGLVDRASILLASPYYRHRGTSVGTRLGQQRGLCSSVSASMGSSDRTESGDPPPQINDAISIYPMI